MSNPNVLPSKRVVVADRLDPVAQTAATVTTGWVSMATFDELLAIIQTGTMGASGTLDAKLQQATDSSGTGAKDIAGKAITQIVKATGDAKQALINLRSDELDVANSFAFVRLSLTVGTATSPISALLLGFDARYQPATANTSVVQTVN